VSTTCIGALSASGVSTAPAGAARSFSKTEDWAALARPAWAPPNASNAVMDTVKAKLRRAGE
jgi:hypothetical protein